MEINRREIFRYLGYKGVLPSDDIRTMVEDAVSRLLQTAEPRVVSDEFAVTTDADELQIGPLNIRSRDLYKNLSGCESCVLFAATLGIAADSLIRRETIISPARGAVMQASSAAMIEAVCNEFQASLRQKKAAEGLWLRPRFSPGYGDLPLALQQEIIPLLKAPQRIGLTVTESSIMVPMKSVTAFIGISRTEMPCYHENCSDCAKINCAFRLE